MTQLWTLSTLAEELGKDRRALAKALDDLPPDETSGDERVSKKWRLARVFAHLMGTGELDGNAERARKDKESADKLALENATTRGELIAASDAQAAWGDHVAAARAKLLSLPTKLGPQLINVTDPNIIAGRIRVEVHAAVNELAEWNPQERDGGFAGDPVDLAEPARANGKSVGRRKATAQ